MIKPEKSPSNLVLYIETGSDESILALFSNEDLVDIHRWSGRGELSEKLIYEIDSLLSRNNSRKDNLTKIAISTGPGSYTGLRIGITVANFLSWALKIPIVGASIPEKKLICQQIDGQYALPQYSSDPKITKPKNN